MKTKRWALSAVWAALPVVCMAHPGHGHEDPWSIAHLLVNPEHYVPIAIVISLIVMMIARHYVITRKIRK